MPSDAQPLIRGRALIIANLTDACNLSRDVDGIIGSEGTEILDGCGHADVSKLERHLLELQCDQVEVVRNVAAKDLRAGGIFSGLAAEGMRETQECVLVFVLAEGKHTNGTLLIRAADGEWVSMEELSKALLADTDACLCSIIASTFCFKSAEPAEAEHKPAENEPRTFAAEGHNPGSNLLLRRQLSQSNANIPIGSTRTLVHLWALASLEHGGWIHEGGTLLTHIVSDRISRAGDCAHIEESLVDTLRSIEGYAAAKVLADGSHPSQQDGASTRVRQAQVNAECKFGIKFFGAGQVAFGSDGRRERVAGRGHRLEFRGKGVAQPSFSPSGNTIVDNDGALIKSKQWQIFGVHTEVVKVTMLTRTAGAEIFYTVDGSAPDPSSAVSRDYRAGEHSMLEPHATRRYNGKGVVLEYTGDGNRDFVVRALAMTQDGKQSRISESPVYRIQGRVQTVKFKAERNDDCVMLHLESATPAASIFYEESEKDPRPSFSKEYIEPLRVRSRTVRAMAVKQGMTPSRFSNFVLHEQVRPPVPRVEGTLVMSSSLDPAPMLVYKDEATVTLTHVDADKSGYAVYYSVDGNPPTTLSPKYRHPVTVSKAGTHRMCFIAMVPMLADSNEATVEFTVMNQVPPPCISPPQGCFRLRSACHGEGPVTVYKQQATISFESAAATTQATAGVSGGGGTASPSIFFRLDGQAPVVTALSQPRAPNTYLYENPLHLSRIDPAHFSEGAPLQDFTRDPVVPLRIKVLALAAQQVCALSRRSTSSCRGANAGVVSGARLGSAVPW